MSALPTSTSTPAKSPESPDTIASTSSPPFSPKTSTATDNHDDTQTKILKYKVASHSVRITKNGYAIEPVELRYREILNGLSSSSRRASDASFDSNQIGHQVLSLIRGFWSQPAFPKGRAVVRSDKHASLESILAEFSQNPPYPHRETHGSAGKQKRSKSRSKRRILLPHSPANKQNSLTKAQSPASPSSRSNKNESSKDKASTTEKSATDGSQPQYRSRSPKVSKASLISSVFLPKSHAPQASAPPPSNNNYHTWIPGDKEQIFDLLKNLCQQMERVFSNESRIVKVNSPCTVLGDIHGNLSDLRNYERSLWPKAPVCVSCNYLFLGDYVDRGEYSVECVLYLFAMKLISPHKFFLLRGNHEVAAIQKQYTFSRECEVKFGSVGKQIWKNFNKVFNVMPVAAIIDDQIFCAHGGIPRSITEVKRLAREIPCPLDNPEIQCPAAWEILWNDPITDSELIGMIEMDNAVVTQTQITQTQALPDGQDLVTTTSSTTIASDAPHTTETSNSTATNTKSTSDAPATNDNNGATSGSGSSSSAQEQDRGLNEADSILTREPSVALSFYIKPEESQTPAQDDGSTGTKSVTSNANEEAKSDDTTLRTIPSDTSSIASTSPQQILNDGFVANIKRGTAFLFSDQAINNFLKVNNLSHVIRAHEVIPTGFTFHGDGRVITIFSSSKYCGLNNQAACALVDGDRIRILRLDTGDAGE